MFLVVQSLPAFQEIGLGSLLFWAGRLWRQVRPAALDRPDDYPRTSDHRVFSPEKISFTCSVLRSSSVTPVMEKLAEAYKEKQPNVQVEIQQSDSCLFRGPPFFFDPHIERAGYFIGTILDGSGISGGAVDFQRFDGVIQ